ncbi:MAG TPA: class I SAM-dependent methyltransferase [Chthoniobacteraceae bacterium]|jgi:SAM-dependent methyltransferase|nr:class I SAM-dependent methyltransferase [Chthoniobacteraceae bacterium]
MPPATCPVCHAPARPIYQTQLAGAPWMYRCEVCGHCAAQPMPRALATDYDEGYTASDAASRKTRRLAPNYLRKIRPYLPPAPFRFLEVGGSHGWLAQAVRDECGAEVLLLEPGRSAVAAARARGLAAECGYLGSFPLAQSFDVVFAGHVIEHVPDPGEFLAQCHAAVRPGGLLILLTPNARAWKLERHGLAWAWAVPQDHTLFLSPESARRLVVAQGFEPTAIEGRSPGLTHYPFFLVRRLAERQAPAILRRAAILPERALLGLADLAFGASRADELLVVARRA